MRVILTVGFVSLITCSLAVPVPAPSQPAGTTHEKSTNSSNQNKDNAPKNANSRGVRTFRSTSKGRVALVKGGRVKDLPGLR
jgi:hypothetical protein